MAGVYGTPIVSVQAAAVELAPYSEGASPEDVAAYLSHLGGIGAGLYEMLQAEQDVGTMFHAVFKLSMLADMVLANHYNCLRLCVLGHDVLVLLDNAGRRGAAVRAIGLEALAACFEDICCLVDSFTQPGWLLRLTCDTRLREEFETLHQAVLELVKGEGLLSLAGARPPVAVDYRDFARPLRRMLKQIGSGSLTAGMQQLRVNDKGCLEVSRLLGVTYSSVKDEIMKLPRSDLELTTLYQQLLQPSSVLQVANNNDGSMYVGDSANGKAGSRPGSRAGSRPGSRRASAADAAGAANPQSAGASPFGRRCSSSFSMSSNSPAAASLYGDLFKWYDRNKSGALEREELQAALVDLGILNGKSAAEARSATVSYMRMADAAAFARGDGIGFDAFCRFYESLVMAKAQQQLRFKLGLQVEDDLRTTFLSFAGFGSREPVTDMDGAHFQKLCRDCGLLDRHTGSIEVDLVFTAVKNKGVRKITFEQFLTALAKLAERKGSAFEDVVMKVLTADGPIANATMAGRVRLHDDKSSYTGIYARGGPSPVDQTHIELSLIVDRSMPESAKRGAGSPSNAGSSAHARRPNVRSFGGGNGGVPSTPFSHGNGLSRASSMNGVTPFAAYEGVTPRGSAADRPVFTPRGHQIMRRASSTAASMTPKPSGDNLLVYHNTPRGPSSGVVAAAAAAAAEAAAAALNAFGSRRASNTCTPSVLDASGQPASADNSSVVQCSNNNSSDQQQDKALRPAGHCTSAGGSLTPTLGSSSRWYSSGLLGTSGGAAAGGSSGSRRCSRDPGVESCQEDVAEAHNAAVRGALEVGTPEAAPNSGETHVQLRDVFAAFAGFGIRSPGVWAGRADKSGAGAGCDAGAASRHMQQPEVCPSVFKPLVLEMDGFRFVKLCREAALFDDNFTTTGADIIFTKVKTKGAKKINYAQFMTALSLVAALKKVQPQQVVQMVLACGGPTINSSLTLDLNRLHDHRPGASSFFCSHDKYASCEETRAEEL